MEIESVNDNKIVFTGTYVPDAGEPVEITKEIPLTVDWYGGLSLSIVHKYRMATN